MVIKINIFKEDFTMKRTIKKTTRMDTTTVRYTYKVDQYGTIIEIITRTIVTDKNGNQTIDDRTTKLFDDEKKD